MFEIGKEYPFSKIEKFMNNKLHCYYGIECIGAQAIHIQEENKDYWFIFNSATNKEYFYKCVYIN